MTFKIKRLSMKEANKLSDILKNYSCEALIKSGKFCIDGKSLLGILASMESEQDIFLEINELASNKRVELTEKLTVFIDK